MTGIIYLILALLLGIEAVRALFNLHKSTADNLIWVLLPTAFGAGTLLMTWSVYLLSWAYYAFTSSDNPLFFGNTAVMCAVVVLLSALYGRRFCLRKDQNSQPENSRTVQWISDRKLFGRECVFFTALEIFLLLIMFYVFFIRDDTLYCGYTVFGDYAPHISVMRSFSQTKGANFPTQYPHFGGEDIKYHFMFQFFVGNLEYLGMRLDWAYNLAGTFALEGFFMLLYKLAVRITGSRPAGVLSIFLVIFRSGFAFFQFLWDNFGAGTLTEALRENTTFIGYTANENWGLWNFNVYLNQRHLGFGMMIVAAAVWFFLERIEETAESEETGIAWCRARLFCVKAWKPQNPVSAVMIGVLLGMCAFWNGTAVIGGLLILLGFAAFSDGKLDYALTALTAVVLSCMQTSAFISGKAVSFDFYWGFLADDKSIWGVIRYLFQISGFVFLGLVILAFFMKRKQRLILTSFLIPVLFAFCFSLTGDITVNHKYVIISYAFVTMFWAWAVAKLACGGAPKKILAGILTLCLTLTGLYDFVIIIRDNGADRSITVQTDSPLTEWLVENLDSEDLILTPEYSINEVTVSGVRMYLGWPYYAWSAGYDTYYRADTAKKIYAEEDPSELKKTVEREGITWILYEEGMDIEGSGCREDVIAESCPLAYTSQDGRIRLYDARAWG